MGKRKLSLDDQLKKDLKGSEANVLLKQAHLPQSYPKCTPVLQRKYRLRTLHSWFDLALPHILVTNLDNLAAALFLWVEFYYKPAELNSGKYYFQDPEGKYEMVKNCLRDNNWDGEPTKTVMTASRRMSKTETFVQQLMPMMGICRPFTPMLLSEINDARTGEEIGKIKEQVEENEIIHADFGGSGVLYPRTSRAGKKWSGHHLKFIHHPGSEIIGHSLNSSQRGRGPLFGIIDDPEDEDNSYNKEFRRWLMDKILRVYVSMFPPGGKFLWIGTPVHRGSCLSMAMKGLAEDGSQDEAAADKRLYDFHKIRYPIMYRNENGDWVSRQPERITVAQFKRKMEINPMAVKAEILCEPVTPGDRVFRYDYYKHGFMHCTDETGQEYFLDLLNGDRKPWKDFIDGLRVFGAGDLADGVSTDDDAGALVYVGIGSDRTIYVLDAFVKKCRVETLIEMSAVMGMVLNCEAIGWERVALQVVINRFIKRYYEKLRAEGKLIPQVIELDNMKKNKVRRILNMVPMFGRYEIRFLYFSSIEDEDGTVHTPVPFERQASYEELLDQVQEFTDEGIRGPDDAIDTLEMAIRLSGDARGEEIVADEDLNMTDTILAKWGKLGMSFDKAQIPMEAWTPKMHEEATMIPMDPATDLYPGIMPYV